MTKPTAKQLEVLALLDEGRHTDALAVMLEVWRRSPSPTLALAIDRLSALPVAPDERVVRRAWKALEGEPTAEQVPLLVALFDFGGTKTCIDALAVVARWPPDPRVARAIARSLGTDRHRGFDAEERFVLPACRLLATLKDASVLPLLEAAVERARPSLTADVLAEQLALLRLALGETGSRNDGWASALEALSPFSERPRRGLEPLWAALRERPGDEQVQQLLADALQERGDLRGEFIALQRSPDASAQERARGLLRKHWRTWVGDEVASRTRVAELTFEKGFLRAIVIGRGEVQASALASALAMVTVEHLEVAPEFVEDFVLLATTPALPLLSSVGVRSRAQARALLAAGWPPRLRCAVLEVPSSELLAVIDTCRATTRVHELWLRAVPARAVARLASKLNDFESVRWTGAAYDAPEVASAVLAAAPSFPRTVTVGYEDDALQARWRAGHVSLAARLPRTLIRLLEALPAEHVAQVLVTPLAGGPRPTKDEARELVRSAARLSGRVTWVKPAPTR